MGREHQLVIGKGKSDFVVVPFFFFFFWLDASPTAEDHLLTNLLPSALFILLLLMLMSACVCKRARTLGRAIGVHSLPGCASSLPHADCCLCPGLPAASPKAQYLPGLGEMQGNSREPLPKTSGFWQLSGLGHQEEGTLSAAGRASGSSCSNCGSNTSTRAKEPRGMNSLPL